MSLNTEEKVLLRHHQFVRDVETDVMNSHSWEVRAARKFYDQLYKEFALVDFSDYKSNRIGMRWRTRAEVLLGKGQSICASLTCDHSADLLSYEVPFAYVEDGIEKQELVKTRVCPKCAKKLFKQDRERMKEAKRCRDVEGKPADNNNMEEELLVVEGVEKSDQDVIVVEEVPRKKRELIEIMESSR